MGKLFAIIGALMVCLVMNGCSPDYGIVYSDTRYIEVPIYVEQEVPEDPGLVWVDSFTQVASVDGIDILWIIDTSGSMISYEPELLAGIEAMLLALPKSGWRLAMMSNDPDQALIESQFPLVPGDDIVDATNMYNSMGVGGWEEGFDAAYEYIENNPYSFTWMRSDAALLVVFVSDEEEQSNQYMNNVSDFTSWFGSLRGHNAVYLASVVNVEVEDSICASPPHTAYIGSRYIEATNYFNGVVVDICDEDWSTGVRDSTIQLEPYEFIELTHDPIEESIRVFTNGSLFNDWYYDILTNKVHFNTIPTSGVLVEVGYRYIPEDTGN